MPPAPPAPTTLRATLEDALLDALQGDPPGPALYGRLATVARGILLRHGLGAARVEIGPAPDGVRVTITLPPGPTRVARLVLHLGTG